MGIALTLCCMSSFEYGNRNESDANAGTQVTQPSERRFTAPLTAKIERTKRSIKTAERVLERRKKILAELEAEQKARVQEMRDALAIAS